MSALVYRVYDAAGLLLYVGCTKQPIEQRMRGHELQSPWWPFYDTVETTEYEKYADARFGEFTAITTEHPRWNVRDRSLNHPDGPLSHRFSAHWLANEVDIWREGLRIRSERAHLNRALRRLEVEEEALAARIDRVIQRRRPLADTG